MVEESKRSESRFDAQYHAEKIAVEIILLINKDFGIVIPNDGKDIDVGKWALSDNIVHIEGDLRTKSSNITDTSLIIQFQNDGVITLGQYKTWILNKYKELLWSQAQDLILFIRTANSINPICISEFYERRAYQNRALSTCFSLIGYLDQLVTVLGAKPKKYTQLIALLNEELRMLKKWRSSDYKKLAGCARSEEKIRKKALDDVRVAMLAELKNIDECDSLAERIKDAIFPEKDESFYADPKRGHTNKKRCTQKKTSTH